MCKLDPHGRVISCDPQTTQHIPLLTDGPQRNLLHAALTQTWQDGDVTQGDWRNFLPRSSESDLTLPVKHDMGLCHFLFPIELKSFKFKWILIEKSTVKVLIWMLLYFLKIRTIFVLGLNGPLLVCFYSIMGIKSRLTSPTACVAQSPSSSYNRGRSCMINTNKSSSQFGSEVSNFCLQYIIIQTQHTQGNLQHTASHLYLTLRGRRSLRPNQTPAKTSWHHSETAQKKNTTN